MVDLKLDLDQIDEVATDLKKVGATFSATEAFSSLVSAAVGHHGLAGTVQDFAGQWNDKRAEMTERVGAVASAMEAIHDAFVEVDDSLAAGLSGSGEAGSNGGAE